MLLFNLHGIEWNQQKRIWYAKYVLCTPYTYSNQKCSSIYVEWCQSNDKTMELYIAEGAVKYHVQSQTY